MAHSNPDVSLSYRNVDTQPIPIGTVTVPEPWSKVEFIPLPRSLWTRHRALCLGLGAAGVLLALAGGALLLARHQATAPQTSDAPDQPRTIPTSLVPYYERAQAGDVNAMRMLGTMYYNGLNVPQDMDEGIRWYRKAANAGSLAATKDLAQLGVPAGPN